MPAPRPHASFRVATSALRVCLWQLPDLHAIPRQRGDQQAIPLRVVADIGGAGDPADQFHLLARLVARDRKSTRPNSSHVSNSYAVFCMKKKKRQSAPQILSQ